MKKSVLLILLISLLSSCAGQQTATTASPAPSVQTAPPTVSPAPEKTPAAAPSPSPSPAPETAPASPDVWEPYYTGGEREWDYAEPWADTDGEEFSLDQSEGMEAFFNLTGHRGGDDFGGCYINVSGTLSILVTDPTAERAEYYGSVCGDAGVWIVEAEYSEKELESAMEQARAVIEKWLEDNPDAFLRLDHIMLDTPGNRVEVEMTGRDSGLMLSQIEVPDCVVFDITETAGASVPAEIPREPVTEWSEIEGVVFRVAQAEHPVGVEKITIICENRTDGEVLYGYSFTMDKFVDGGWVTASGTLSFNAVGLTLMEYDKSTLEIHTGMFPEPLGPGLYRITGCTIRHSESDQNSAGGDYQEAGPYVLEFVVTEDAQPEEAAVAAATGREDWQWDNIGVIAGSVDPPYLSAGELYGQYSVLFRQSENEGEPLIIDIYDRAESRFVAEGMEFDADFFEDLRIDRDGNMYIRAADGVYRVFVADGEVTVEPGAQFPDPDIPFEPKSSDTALDGALSVEMEQAYYPAGTESVALLITNNSEYDLSFEYRPPRYDIYRYDWVWWQNCWYDDPERTPVESLWGEPVRETIAAGETQRVEIKLADWSCDGDDGEVIPLDRGIYRLVCSNRELQSGENKFHVSFSVEFALE